jgi:hypothetical protein
MRDSSAILSFSIRQNIKHFCLTNIPRLKPRKILPFKVIKHHSVSFLPLIEAPAHISFDWDTGVISFNHVVLK